MITIYNPKGWVSAERLAFAIRDLGAKCQTSRVVPNDGSYVVGWGFSCPRASLNKANIGNKFREIETLQYARVPTMNVSRRKPETGEWLGRKVKHCGGNDLITTRTKSDYYTERLQVDLEFRVHVFKDKVMCVGMKRPSTVDHHPWIRSKTLGWSLDYGKLCQAYITDNVRLTAKKAVTALGYDFGAVDIGLVGDRAVVFEVNTAPGLTWATSVIYAKQIIKSAR